MALSSVSLDLIGVVLGVGVGDVGGFRSSYLLKTLRLLTSNILACNYNI